MRLNRRQALAVSLGAIGAAALPAVAATPPSLASLRDGGVQGAPIAEPPAVTEVVAHSQFSPQDYQLYWEERPGRWQRVGLAHHALINCRQRIERRQVGGELVYYADAATIEMDWGRLIAPELPRELRQQLCDIGPGAGLRLENSERLSIDLGHVKLLWVGAQIFESAHIWADCRFIADSLRVTRPPVSL